MQRNPNLFDGVIARAPAYNWVGFMGAFNRRPRHWLRRRRVQRGQDGDCWRRRCATPATALDGIVDGVVSNQAACTPSTPRRCAAPAASTPATPACRTRSSRSVTSWTTDAVFTGSATYRNAGWGLTGNEDDPGAWAVWVTGNGNVTDALQYLFQDTTVKNYLARDPAANSLAYTPGTRTRMRCSRWPHSTMRPTPTCAPSATAAPS